MGQVIKKKLNGMSWWMKTSLVLLLTMATSVLMYQGWYMPKDSLAAPVTYVVQAGTTDNLGADGNCNLPTGTPAAAQAAPLYTTLGLTETGTATRYYGPVVTNATVIKAYTPVYASATDISGISASFAARGSTAGDTITLRLYDYDPAGAAGNKTLVATTAKVGTLTTTVAQYTWASTDFTISGTGRVAAGHRLLLELVGNSTVTSSRFMYCGVAGATSSSNITFTETPVAANSTTIDNGTPLQTVQTVTVNSATPPASFVNAFGLSVGTGSADSISSANVTVAGTGTAVINTVQITSLDEATIYGTSSTNVAGVYTVPLSPSIAAPLGTATQYRVRIVPKGSGVIANGTYPVTANISAITSSLGNTVVDNDTADATITFSVVAAQPPSTFSSCTGCHGYSSSFTDGTGRNNPAGYFQGNHNKHAVVNATACSVCHVAPATTTSADYSHSNGTVNMAASISGGTYSKGSAALNNTFTGGTCGTTTCHGTTSPAWGSSNLGACLSCHSDTTATSSFKTTAGTTNSVKSTIHVSHLNNSHGYKTTKLVCADCHTVPATVGDAGHNDTALPAEASLNSTLARVGGLSSTFNGTNCSSVWCHGSGLASNSGTSLPATVVLSPTFGTTLLSGTPSADCAKCHGYPPNTTTHSGKTPTDCITCHTHVNSTGTGFTVLSLHIDGKVDASGGSCTGCHITGGAADKNGRVTVVDQFAAGNSHHVQSGAAVTTTACYACHWEANLDGSINATYHTQVANSPVNLVVWNTTARPTTYTLNTTSVEYLSGGASASPRTEIIKINKQCLGCHNASNSGTSKFAGDTNVPSKYAWEAGLSIDARYSQTGTTAWGKFTGNATNGKTASKAFSAHGQATKNNRGWSTVADTYPVAKATSNILCFDCHNSHGSSTIAAGITSSYSSATGRRKGGILKDVTSGKGGYVTTYKPVAGGSASTRNVYNSGAALCFDCHNTATEGVTPWGYTSTFGYTPPPAQGPNQGVLGVLDTPYFGNAGTNFITTLAYAYKAGMSVSQGGHFGASTSKGAFTGIITKRAFDPGTPTGTVIQGLCTPCHDPHGVSPTVATTQTYSVPMLKGTWVTSPYRLDAAPTTVNRGGGSRVSPAAGTAAGPNIASYRLDQNTFVAAGTTTTGWVLTTNATTLQTTNDTQFAGLCTGCHAKANLNDAAAASSANWKTRGRIHNSVKGWASTAGGNSGNKVHAYTCSKCHTPHNSRLPRLMVMNCLDIKHKGRAASGGNMTAANSTGNSSGSGTGRFPGGGGTLGTGNPGANSSPLFFGGAATYPNCHDSATAGGATYSTTAEQWNTKTLW